MQHGLASSYRRGCRCDTCRPIPAHNKTHSKTNPEIIKAQHGLQSTYRNHFCRCDQCTAANADYQRDKRRDRKARIEQDATSATHGKASTYDNYCCRCHQCRANHREKQTEYNRRVRASRPPKPPYVRTPAPHGTLASYETDRCRCDQCKTAKRQHGRQVRAEFAERVAADPSLAEHANANTSYRGCRCQPCTEAVVQRQAGYKAARRAATTTPDTHATDRT